MQGYFCRTACAGIVGCGGTDYVCRTVLQDGREYDGCFSMNVVQPG